MYNGKIRRFRNRSPAPSLMLNVFVLPNRSRPRRTATGHSYYAGRCTWPRAVGSTTIAISAPGKRGTRATRASSAAAQLPRRRRQRPGRGPVRRRRCRSEGEPRTKVGRQVLVGVRFVPGGRRDGNPRPAGRPETGGRRRDNQRRIHQRFAHLAFQAAKVGSLTRSCSPVSSRCPADRRHCYNIIIIILYLCIYYVIEQHGHEFDLERQKRRVCVCMCVCLDGLRGRRRHLSGRHFFYFYYYYFLFVFVYPV